MSLVEDKSKGDKTSDEQAESDMAQEDKIHVEEVFINMGPLKEELLDEETPHFEQSSSVDQIKSEIKTENTYEENLIKIEGDGDSSMDFLDDDIKMEETIVKLEVKEEKESATNVKDYYCNYCGASYLGYCPKCSTLSHILNNIVLDLNSESELDTTPRNILEIRSGARIGVFTLRTLPKNIIFGPFKGISAIESTNGYRWKIKDSKFANDENGNWMRYVCAVNQFSSNLEIFQYAGNLYFETTREIKEGEELLMCFGDEVKLDNEEECYFVPVKKEESPKIYACALCCLGFRLERCLMEHKSKCPHEKHHEDVQEFEVSECQYCKLWLEKQEQMERHTYYCTENYERQAKNSSNFRRKNVDKDGNDAASTSKYENLMCITDVIVEESGDDTKIDARMDKYPERIKKRTKKYSNVKGKRHKCPQCSYQTDYSSNLKTHLNTHKGIKPFECEICKKRLSQLYLLKRHMRELHSNISDKKYKCPKCLYQTNYKQLFGTHLNTHKDVKPYQCDICKKRWNQIYNLKRHIRDVHSGTNEKEYKCSNCSYQTNYKHRFTAHLNTHMDVKPFQCDLCKKRFSQTYLLKRHMQDSHSDTDGKKYKCPQCPYQTNYTHCLNIHLNTHKDIKPFQCDICGKGYCVMRQLQRHIKDSHTDAKEKDHKCPNCPYQTNYKNHLNAHLHKHTEVTFFHCGVCKKGYSQAYLLRRHERDAHSGVKKYKCPMCSYQTNYKNSIDGHVKTHKDVKIFENIQV